MAKKVLFLCGSPRGKRSASRDTAEYMSRFLDHDYDFYDLADSKMSPDPSEADSSFQIIAEKIRNADAVVWTFGAWSLYVPHDMHYLFQKLFTIGGFNFSGKLAGAIMSSIRVHDDYILRKIQFISEQIGFGYIGDVSAVGNPFFGYTEDEEVTESSCRMLADRLNHALDTDFVPSRFYTPVAIDLLSANYRGVPISISDIPEYPSTGEKTILVITGYRLDENEAGATVCEAVRRFSKNRVQIVSLQEQGIKPCIGCYVCDFYTDGKCTTIKDSYEQLKARMLQADAIVLVGNAVAYTVDSHMKAFIDRNWGIAHRPSLAGRYGFTVALGGGSLEEDAAWYMSDCVNKWGATSIGVATQAGAKDESSFVSSLRWLTEQLDRAIEKKWQVAERYRVLGVSHLFRDLAKKYGMILRADYKYHKGNRPFNYLDQEIGAAFLRLMFRNKKMAKLLIKIKKEQNQKARNARMQTILKNEGRFGEGREIAR